MAKKKAKEKENNDALWFTFHPERFKNGTYQMSDHIVGRYIRLLLNQWVTGFVTPDQKGLDDILDLEGEIVSIKSTPASTPASSDPTKRISPFLYFRDENGNYFPVKGTDISLQFRVNRDAIWEELKSKFNLINGDRYANEFLELRRAETMERVDIVRKAKENGSKGGRASAKSRGKKSRVASTPASTDPSTPASTDPSTPASTDPSTPASTDPSTPASTDPSSDPTNRSNSYSFSIKSIENPHSPPSAEKPKTDPGSNGQPESPTGKSAVRTGAPAAARKLVKKELLLKTHRNGPKIVSFFSDDSFTAKEVEKVVMSNCERLEMVLANNTIPENLWEYFLETWASEMIAGGEELAAGRLLKNFVTYVPYNRQRLERMYNDSTKNVEWFEVELKKILKPDTDVEAMEDFKKHYLTVMPSGRRLFQQLDFTMEFYFLKWMKNQRKKSEKMAENVRNLNGSTGKIQAEVSALSPEEQAAYYQKGME